MDRHERSDFRIWQAREWIATFLATGLIIYEAGVEHSAHATAYGVALVLYGFVPISAGLRRVGQLGRYVAPEDDEKTRRRQQQRGQPDE